MVIDGGGFELLNGLFHWNGLWVVKSGLWFRNINF